MSYDKAPGQSGLTTDMIKNLPPEALNFLIQRIQDFWRDPNVDYEAWHTTILSTIYKGRGDPQDPNNHRGIALKETSAKVLSIILADRLLTRLRQKTTHRPIRSYWMPGSPAHHKKSPSST